MKLNAMTISRSPGCNISSLLLCFLSEVALRSLHRMGPRRGYNLKINTIIVD